LNLSAPDNPAQSATHDQDEDHRRAQANSSQAYSRPGGEFSSDGSHDATIRSDPMTFGRR
jgi:hypothetical protein